MPDHFEQLNSLSLRIAARNDLETPAEYVEHLAVAQSADDFHLDFFGDSFGESYLDLLETIAQPEIACRLRSLILRGPDDGANGTHHWDLAPLLAANASFPRLELCSVRLTQPGDHNRSIIGAMYQEEGVLSRLLDKSPNLRSLTVPSAPSSAFFEVGARPIRFLSVDAGYDTQHFIARLAKSSCFPELRCLEWGEYNETYMDDFASQCTPLEDYRELFTSPAFSPVARFVWRNPACSEEDIQRLAALRPDLQMLIVRFSQRYARTSRL